MLIPRNVMSVTCYLLNIYLCDIHMLYMSMENITAMLPNVYVEQEKTGNLSYVACRENLIQY